jgi:peptide/nickel transport system ATP-binding protein
MSAGTAAPLLRVERLHKRYRVAGSGSRGGFVAVDEVSFEVPEGGSLGIVGESGSGKTTVAKMLVGLERPTGGRIVFAGTDRTRVSQRSRARRERGREMQIVFQDPYTSLDRRQSVGECLAEVIRLHFGRSERQVRDRVHELASMVGLDERQVGARPRALSGGQRQRVAIARALAAQPRALILDESVAALDVSVQAQILNLLADIRERTGITYLFISHDLAVIRQITESTIVMRRGKIVEGGPTPAVLDTPTSAYTRLLRDSVPRPGWTPHARHPLTKEHT